MASFCVVDIFIRVVRLMVSRLNDELTPCEMRWGWSTVELHFHLLEVRGLRLGKGSFSDRFPPLSDPFLTRFMASYREPTLVGFRTAVWNSSVRPHLVAETIIPAYGVDLEDVLSMLHLERPPVQIQGNFPQLLATHCLPTANRDGHEPIIL